MDYTYYIFFAVLALVAIAAYVWGTYASATKILALKEKLDAQSSTPKAKNTTQKAKTQKSTPQKDNSKDAKAFNDAKKDLKKVKSQLHSAKQEIKSLKKDVKKQQSDEPQKKKGTGDVTFQLREEIGQLKSELERVKATSKEKKKAKPPSAVDAEKAVANALENAEDGSKEAVEALTAAHKNVLSSLKEKHRKAEKEMRTKLRKASSNVDKQRRRADNNDRAYKITQRQIDALQERISFLEKGSDATGISERTTLKVDPKPEVSVVKSEPKKATKEVSVEQQSSLDFESDVPRGLNKPSEPTTIEMSADIANSLINDNKKIPINSNTLVEPSVDDAWAEFDVD